MPAMRGRQAIPSRLAPRCAACTVGSRLNWRRGEFAPTSNLRELRGQLVALGVLAVAVAGLGLGSLYLQNHFKSRRLAQVQDGIAKAFREMLPGTRMVQPVAQMREKMGDLDRRLRAFGGLTGAQLSGCGAARVEHPRAGVAAGRDRRPDHQRRRGRTERQHGLLRQRRQVAERLGRLAAAERRDINNTRQGLNNTVQFKLSLRAVNGLDGTP